jgi:NlpC/P60 family putative phage cell wall peptidase
MKIAREEIVALARGWIGTPYRHQGTRKGVGCDCLGLVRGVWRELHGAEAEAPGPYRIHWALPGGRERLAEAAERHCGAAVPAGEALPGDILIFRWKGALPASHAGILSAKDRFIHAYAGEAVVESALTEPWRRRIAFVFRFPEAE